MDTTDTHSVASGGSTLSASLVKMECPYCNKDFQTRSMVNHIHNKHRKEFLDGLTLKWIEKAEAGEPLKLYWEKKDDFDEIEIMNLYTFLGNYKTFMLEERALQFAKKNPDMMKEHNKELTKLKKEYMKKKQEEKKLNSKLSPEQQRFYAAKQSNDPSLVRAMYRHALHMEPVIERLIDSVKPDVPLTHMSNVGNGYGHEFASLTVEQLIEMYKDTKEKLHEAIQEKLLSYRVLNAILTRFDRVLCLRDIPTTRPSYAFFRTTENPEGQLLVGDEVYGFLHPDYPVCPF